MHILEFQDILHLSCCVIMHKSIVFEEMSAIFTIAIVRQCMFVILSSYFELICVSKWKLDIEYWI